MKRLVGYIRQRSFSSKFIVRTHTHAHSTRTQHTHTHTHTHTLDRMLNMDH